MFHPNLIIVALETESRSFILLQREIGLKGLLSRRPDIGLYTFHKYFQPLLPCWMQIFLDTRYHIVTIAYNLDIHIRRKFCMFRWNVRHCRAMCDHDEHNIITRLYVKKNNVRVIFTVIPIVTISNFSDMNSCKHFWLSLWTARSPLMFWLRTVKMKSG